MHKSECANLKRVSPKIVPDAARLMARIIVKLNKGGADEIGYYTDNSFRKFKDLMSRRYSVGFVLKKINKAFALNDINTESTSV